MAAKRRRSQKDLVALTAASSNPTDDVQDEAPPTSRRRSTRSSTQQQAPGDLQTTDSTPAARPLLTFPPNPFRPEPSQQIFETFSSNDNTQGAYEDFGFTYRPSRRPSRRETPSDLVDDSDSQNLIAYSPSRLSRAPEDQSHSPFGGHDAMQDGYSASSAPRRHRAHKEVLDLFSEDMADIDDDKRSKLTKSHFQHAPAKKSKASAEIFTLPGLGEMPQKYRKKTVNPKLHHHRVTAAALASASNDQASSSSAGERRRWVPEGTNGQGQYTDDPPNGPVDSPNARRSPFKLKLRLPVKTEPQDSERDGLFVSGNPGSSEMSSSDDESGEDDILGLSLLDSDVGENLSSDERNQIRLALMQSRFEANCAKKKALRENVKRKAALQNHAVADVANSSSLPIDPFLTSTDFPTIGQSQSQSTSGKDKGKARLSEPWKMTSRAPRSITEIPPSDGSCPLLDLPEELLFMVGSRLSLSSNIALSASCRALNVFSHNYMAFPLPCTEATYGFRASSIYDNQKARLKRHSNLAYLSRRKNYYLQQPTMDNVSVGWSIAFVDTLRKIWYDYPKANKSLRIRSCTCGTGYNTFNLRKEKYLGSSAKIAHEAWHYLPSFCRRCKHLMWWAEVLNVQSDQVTYTFSKKMPGKGERPIPLAYGEQALQAAGY